MHYGHVNKDPLFVVHPVYNLSADCQTQRRMLKKSRTLLKWVLKMCLVAILTDIVQEVKELIASTEIEGAQKATLLKHLKSQLEKTKNEVASEQSGILEASVSKEEEKKVLRRQVSNLIDQVS